MPMSVELHSLSTTSPQWSSAHSPSPWFCRSATTAAAYGRAERTSRRRQHSDGPASRGALRISVAAPLMLPSTSMGFCLHGYPHLPITEFQCFQCWILQSKACPIRCPTLSVHQVDGDARPAPSWLAERAPQAAQELHRLQVPHRGQDPDTCPRDRARASDTDD